MKPSEPLNRAQTRARAIRRERVTGIVLTGVWPWEPERATRGDLRKFLAGGLRALRDIAERKELEPEDRRRLFEEAFTVFSQAEQLIWAQVEDSRRGGDEAEGAELLDFSEQDVAQLQAINEEHKADLALMEELGWVEDVSGPEAIVSTDFEDYSL